MSVIRIIARTTFALLVLALGPAGIAAAQVQVTAADPSSATQGTTSLDVTISGSGSLTYTGDPTVQKDISGSGTVVKK
jgi:hypothetical protein